MKKKGYKKYMEKKKMLSGKMIAEIAPAKEKHQVTGKYNFNKDFLLILLILFIGQYRQIMLIIYLKTFPTKPNPL